MNKYLQAKKLKNMRKNIRFDIYQKLWKLGHNAGCHQRPDRSFFLCGYQLPICARCTGVIIGYLLTIPIYISVSFNYIHCLIACFIMFTDWFVQYKRIKESTNVRRLLTGIIGGFGVMGIELLIIVDMVKLIRTI